MDDYVKNKNKDQILSDLYGTARPDTVVHEQLKSAILVRCTEDLEKKLADVATSITNAGEQSKKLSSKLLYLNIILTILTALGLIVTILGVLKQF